MFATRTNLTTRRHLGSKGRDIIGIHTMEAPEGSQTAENVANYFKNVNASAHWCVDDNSRVRVVNDNDTAWTLPGANSRSLNIELAGYAKQKSADWQDEYSIDMLEIAAVCAAEWCIKYDIPVRRLSSEQIRNGSKGFAGHVDVNVVYKQSSHWDPGPAFPWNYFLDRVRAQIAEIRGGDKPSVRPKPPKPTYNNLGYSTDWIEKQQEKLRKLGYKVTPDGLRGQETIAAVKAFQKEVGLLVDGIPGPDTAKALDRRIDAKAPASSKRPDCTGLQRAVRAKQDNMWGVATDRHLYALRAASVWGGSKFPYGVAFTQRVVGTKTDGKWGSLSGEAHTNTVENVQKHLSKLGFDAGEPDGIWGDKTERAFQDARRACRR